MENLMEGKAESRISSKANETESSFPCLILGGMEG
jgi:hypothetical protein